ncbi:hypothetical protein BSY18_3999 (plasmid) [Blastomonas sp. RAC04]|nr:hypothetical protein BSY18_3999 [Blastomonas sp. RAC04]
MHGQIECAAGVRQQWQDMQDRHSHGPEAVRGQGKRNGRHCPEQVDDEMAGIERCELSGNDAMEKWVENDHKGSNDCHHAFRTAATPGGITESNDEQGQKHRYAHADSFSLRLLPVNLCQATACNGATCPATRGHSCRS